MCVSIIEGNYLLAFILSFYVTHCYEIYIGHDILERLHVPVHRAWSRQVTPSAARPYFVHAHHSVIFRVKLNTQPAFGKTLL